jgi:hypothetical protein
MPTSNKVLSIASFAIMITHHIEYNLTTLKYYVCNLPQILLIAPILHAQCLLSVGYKTS